MTQQIHNLPARAWVALLSGIYYAGVGNWSNAGDLLGQVIDISERLGDRGRRDDGAGNLAMVDYFQGNFAQTSQMYDDLAASAQRRSDAHNQAWALRGQVYCMLPQAQFDEALGHLEAWATLLNQNPHVVDEALQIDLHGLKALVHLRRSEPELALEAAEKASHLIAKTSPTSFLSLPGYASTVETFLTLWEDKTNSKTPAFPQASLQQAVKGLHNYARVFPIGQPAAFLWKGVWAWLSGRPGQAQKWWIRSLAAAEKLGMPYAEGLTHYEMGRRLPLDDPARSRHLLRASRIFTRLGVSYDLQRAQEALQCTTSN
jgi:tetratricopeptide (TPR) repeat protein